jgi:signal transduction histidine kinase/integral membrane sensor domain MASE1
VQRLVAPPATVGRRVFTNQNLLAVAIAVAAAYYVSAQVGLFLTFPPATTSVLWPPNAILTSALLLVPMRHWWVCFAAAFPVHVVLEVGAGFSPPLVALLFLTNCSEAAIAAGGLRVVGRGPIRFDSFGRVAAFIGIAGFVAPIVSSFFDAAVVSALRHEPYWDVWRARVFANTLTEISVVPAVVLGVRALSQRSLPSPRALLEGAILGVAVGFVAAGVFGNLRFADFMPGIPRTPTVLLLPLLFWGSVRFGVGGVSAMLLLAALVASVSAAHGFRPFDILPPLESLMAVQLYLTVMSVPLMCLAGLIEERRQAAAELSARLRFEGLLAQISASFVCPKRRSLSVYDECLSRIGQFLQADAVCMDTGRTQRDHERFRQWRRTDNGPRLLGRGPLYFPWIQSRIDEGQTVTCESRDGLPEQANADRAALAVLDLQAAVVVPFAKGGSLVLASHAPRAWREIEVDQVRLLAEVLSNAWLREETEFELQRARHGLAQVARLVSMGELMSSLAHEINQPLTGILSNAQAAGRMLDGAALRTTELRAIVGDIIEDNRRASDVINRMREMTARTATPPEMVDLNAVVRDVAVLVSSETIIRNVSVTLRLTSQPVCVVGARVELQQALLNVLSNAMDAVSDRDVDMRLVHVSVEADERDPASNEDVRVIVRDSGCGWKPPSVPRPFDALADLGADDHGLALAVARAIIENHGGMITTEPDATGGAMVTISLPHAMRSAA